MPEASAPGKLIIVGEYAVLEGAPAIATAVDVRARSTVTPSEESDSVFVDTASGQAFRFFLDADKLRWRDASPESRGTILRAVLEAFRDRNPEVPIPSLRYSIETDAFYASREASAAKLGLGSSAAALVALVGAFRSAVDHPADDSGLFDLSCEAHRRFQGGQGSGVDVATALAGGVVRVQQHGPDATPRFKPMAWPEGLLMLPVWSGSSASTVDLIGRFEAYREEDPAGFEAGFSRLQALAVTAADAWADQSVTNILDSLADYDSALRAMDADGSIGINTETHTLLRDLSEQKAAVYKTSGAGGGDFGIAFTDSPAVIDSLAATFSERGYEVLNSSLNAAGLTVEN
jgi:mevalonate kinase